MIGFKRPFKIGGDLNCFICPPELVNQANGQSKEKR